MRTRLKGFTLAELLVAMTVTAIIMASVATLAYAMGSVNDSSDQASLKQAQVRYATLKIGELLKHCRLICGTPDSDLVIWRADDNGDKYINPREIVYIEVQNGGTALGLLEFTSSSTGTVPLGNLESSNYKTFLSNWCGGKRTALVLNCQNIRFYPADVDVWDKFVSVSFNLVENGVVRNYQIDGALRGWAGNLLDATGTQVISDDD